MSRTGGRRRRPDQGARAKRPAPSEDDDVGAYERGKRARDETEQSWRSALTRLASHVDLAKFKPPEPRSCTLCCDLCTPAWCCDVCTDTCYCKACLFATQHPEEVNAWPAVSDDDCDAQRAAKKCPTCRAHIPASDPADTAAIAPDYHDLYTLKCPADTCPFTVSEPIALETDLSKGPDLFLVPTDQHRRRAKNILDNHVAKCQHVSADLCPAARALPRSAFKSHAANCDRCVGGVMIDLFRAKNRETILESKIVSLGWELDDRDALIAYRDRLIDQLRDTIASLSSGAPEPSSPRSDDPEPPSPLPDVPDSPDPHSAESPVLEVPDSPPPDSPPPDSPDDDGTIFWSSE